MARKAGPETHLVVTPAGQQTRAYETDLSTSEPAAMADVVDHSVRQALDLLGIDVPDLPRWGE